MEVSLLVKYQKEAGPALLNGKRTNIVRKTIIVMEK